MKGLNRSVFPRRRLKTAVVLLCLGLALLPGGTRAAAVALTGIHMAAVSGGNRPAVTAFPAGVRTVYFDYTPLGPYPDDTVEVRVFAGDPGGTAVARARLIVGLMAALSVPLRPAAGGAWPNGGYCTALYVNGVPDGAGGRMPIGWAVGSAQPPAACRHTLPRLLATARLFYAGGSATLRVTVRGGHGRAVAGALVQVDARATGVPSVLRERTGAHGIAMFRRLHLARRGRITVTVTKAGYRRRVFPVQASEP